MVTKRKFSPSGRAPQPKKEVAIVTPPEIPGVDYTGKPPMHYTGCAPAVSKVDQDNWRRCAAAEAEYLAREAEVHAREKAERLVQ